MPSHCMPFRSIPGEQCSTTAQCTMIRITIRDIDLSRTTDFIWQLECSNGMRHCFNNVIIPDRCIKVVGLQICSIWRWNDCKKLRDGLPRVSGTCARLPLDSISGHLPNDGEFVRNSGPFAELRCKILNDIYRLSLSDCSWPCFQCNHVGALPA